MIGRSTDTNREVFKHRFKFPSGKTRSFRKSLHSSNCVALQAVRWLPCHERALRIVEFKKENASGAQQQLSWVRRGVECWGELCIAELTVSADSAQDE